MATNKATSQRAKRRSPEQEKPRRKRTALIARDLTAVDYKDTQLLRTFISDRGKIRARSVTGLTRRQQRDIAAAIKTAREMALLPYTGQRQLSGLERSG